jgi:hypothetical protein
VHQFYKIPYNNNFLDCLTQQIIPDFTLNEFEELIILLPDQNSANELKKIIQQNLNQGYFMPQIIALSDYINLAKAFNIPIDLSDQFHANFIVRDNLCKFILACDFIEEVDKIAYVDDLAKLLSDFYQSGISVSESKLNLLGKSKEEQILHKLLKSFIDYKEFHQLSEYDYILNFKQTNILFKIADLYNNQQSNKKVIFAGSSFSLFVTQFLANAFINSKYNQIYIIDYDNVGLDLDNNFTKDLKSQYDFKLINTAPIAKNEISKCFVFEDNYQEAAFIFRQLNNDKDKAIINSHTLRHLTNNIINPEYYNDDLNWQINLFVSFVLNESLNDDLLKCELFKDKKFQTFLLNQEKQKNFDEFIDQLFNKNAFLEKTIPEKHLIFLNLVNEYQINFSNNLLSNFAKVINCIIGYGSRHNKIAKKLTEFLLSDLKPKISNTAFIKFSYESKLFDSDNIIISGLNKKNWINQSQYKYFKSDILVKFGLRSEIDFQTLALQDFFILFNNQNIVLSYINDSTNDPLEILFLLESQDKLKIIRPNTSFNPKIESSCFINMHDKSAINQISVSDFKLLIQNPYGLYVKKILKLINFESVYKSSLRKIYGVIIHKVIEIYTEKHSEITDDHLAFLVTEFYKLAGKTNYYDILLILETKVSNLFKWWITEHKKLSENSIKTLTETKFVVDFHKHIKVSAIMDRVEIDQNSNFRIVDYKTSKLPSKKDIESGKYTQLILEALIYIKSNNLNIENIKDPILIGLSGDVNFVKNQILELNNFANNLLEFENKIKQTLDMFFDSSTKLFAYPNPESKQYSDYIHLTRLED